MPARDDAYAKMRGQIVDRTKTFSTTYWDSLGSWRDPDIDRFVADLLPVVRGAESQVALLTDAYLAMQLGIEPAGLTDLDLIRGGVPPAEVYRRPANTLYTQLASGSSFELAKDAAITRLAQLITTDLQLSMTHQARHTMAKSKVNRYARTLLGPRPCALCVIASTQRYWKKDLMPIHPGCSCGVRPLKAGEPAEQIIDQQLLDETHAAIRAHLGGSDRSAFDLGLEKTDARDRPISDFTELVVVRNHGEYGPTLTWRGQHFKTAA